MHWKQWIGVSAGLMCVWLCQPGFATPVPEMFGGDSVADHYNIQVIEGDKVTYVDPMAPPVPRLYGGVSEYEFMEPEPERDEIKALIRLYNKKLGPGEVRDIARAIHHYSHRYNLDPRLMASVVAVESSFRPEAVSPTGAIGLGQLKPATAQWLGVADPFNPVENLSGVAKYLRFLLDKYNGSVQHALAAYFQGQGTIDRRGIDDNALSYISKINRVFSRFF